MTCQHHCSDNVLGIYTITSVIGYVGCSEIGSIVISQTADSQSLSIVYTDHIGSFPPYTGILSSDCTHIHIHPSPSNGNFDALQEGIINIDGNTITIVLDWSVTCSFTANK